MQAGAKENLLVATAPAPSGKFADAVATSRPNHQEIIFLLTRPLVLSLKRFFGT